MLILRARFSVRRLEHGYWEFISLDLSPCSSNMVDSPGSPAKQACADIIEQGIEQGGMTINYKVFEMLVQVP